MTDTATTTAPKTTAFTVSPDDAALALRMGWILAELRGRLDPDCPHAPTGVRKPPMLLLDAANERSKVERQIEATKVLSSLGSVDFLRIDINTLSGSGDGKWGLIPAGKRLKTPDMLRYLVCRLITTTCPEIDPIDATLSTIEVTPDEKRTSKGYWWRRVAWFLWAWDEALQDQLSAGKFGTASAYQLGRGLSESYWALNPDLPGDSHQWAFLLGDDRVRALGDLSQRLAPVFSQYTAPAVTASVVAWGTVAKAPGLYEDPIRALERQVLIWRDLLVTGRDPLTLVKPSRLEAVARDPRPIIKAYRWELVVALVLAAGLALSLTYFESQVRSVLTALAAVGITASAIESWIKAKAQSVASRVGTAVDQSVVNEAVTNAPEEKNKRTWRTRIFLPLDPPPGHRGSCDYSVSGDR
jgi:hypothetical protein